MGKHAKFKLSSASLSHLRREVQRPTEGRSTGPNRDRRSQKMDRTGLGPNSVRSGSGLQSWTEGQNPKIQKSNYPIPKSKIRKSKLSKIQAFAESRFPIFRLPPSSGFRHLHHHRKSRHLPASAISIIIVKPLQTTVSIFYLLGFPILLALYL